MRIWKSFISAFVSLLLSTSSAPGSNLPETADAPGAQEPASARAQTTRGVAFAERLLATIPGQFKKPARGWWIVFNPDGTRVAYAAKEGGKEFLVVENQPGPSFTYVGTPVFSPDGATVAYTAVKFSRLKGAQGYVVVGDRRALAQEDGTVHLDWSPKFSADGSRVTYDSKQGSKRSAATITSDSAVQKIEEDGKEINLVVGTPGPESEGVVWSTAYRGGGKANAIVDGTYQERKRIHVAGDEVGPRFVAVREILFGGGLTTIEYVAPERPRPTVRSPDGTREARGIKRGKKYAIVVGQKQGPEFDDVGEPVFSPDGSQVAYWAWNNKAKKYFIVVGEQIGTAFDDVGDPVFSPDGRKVAFGALQGKELWWKVVDIH